MFPSRIVQNSVYTFPNFIILNLKVLACFGLLLFYYSQVLFHYFTFFKFFLFVFSGRMYSQWRTWKAGDAISDAKASWESRLVISLWYASWGHQANTVGSCMLSDSFHKLISLVKDRLFTWKRSENVNLGRI